MIYAASHSPPVLSGVRFRLWVGETCKPEVVKKTKTASTKPINPHLRLEGSGSQVGLRVESFDSHTRTRMRGLGCRVLGFRASRVYRV